MLMVYTINWESGLGVDGDFQLRLCWTWKDTARRGILYLMEHLWREGSPQLKLGVRYLEGTSGFCELATLTCNSEKRVRVK